MIGGGGFSGGGGIENLEGVLVIINSTISGNKVTGFGRSPRGGGISVGDAVHHGGTVDLTNVTIANNSVGGMVSFGGGIANDPAHPGTVTLINTIIDGNTTDSEAGPDCSRTLHSRGFNLVSNTMDCEISRANNIVGERALLLPLAPNGGPTWTHALCPGPSEPGCDKASPAIDKGHPSNISCPRVDQRLFRRPTDGPDANRIATCDIGAFEAFSLPRSP